MQLVRTGVDAFMLVPYKVATAHAAESVPAEEREKERIAFKDAHRHLELDEVPDAWGRPMFKHSHVETSWLGWIARAARAPADSVTVQAGEAAELLKEILAEACCEESETNLTGDHYRRLYDLQSRIQAMLSTPPAQAADSVLEDAARYRWLRERSSTMFVNISINGEGAEIAATLDSAVDAARKQGANHE